MELDNQQGTFTSNDLAWLGGFVDGEGCITLIQKPGKRLCYEPIIKITNCDKEAIDFVHGILTHFNVGHYVNWQNRYPKMDAGYVAIKGLKRCQKGIELLMPFLKTKRQQAEVLKAFIEYRLSQNQKHNYGELEKVCFEKLKLMKRTPQRLQA